VAARITLESHRSVDRRIVGIPECWSSSLEIVEAFAARGETDLLRVKVLPSQCAVVSVVLKRASGAGTTPRIRPIPKICTYKASVALHSDGTPLKIAREERKASP
jgi:hypothetical protein